MIPTLENTYKGGKMRHKIKKLALFSIVAVVVLSISGLAKYLLPHLSTYLNGGEYQFKIEDACLSGSMFLLVISRVSLIRRASN